MPKTKKILFITHDASRTGGPVLLLNLMKILKERGYSIHTLVKNGKGILLKDFEEVSETCVVYNANYKKRASKWRRRFQTITNNYRIRNSFNVDVIINNTITNGDLLPAVRKYYKGHIFTYVHELMMSTQFFTTEDRLRNTLSLTNSFIAPSHAVRNFLVESHSINKDDTSILNYYIPAFNSSANISVDHFRSSNGLSAEFVIGALGTIDWRKGPEIFIQVAIEVLKKRPGLDVQFIWKGCDKKSVEYLRIQHDLAKLNITDKIIFSEASPDVDVFFKCLDLFLLTSREDPYPLVVLEAASQKKPTICFDRSGGAVEFVSGENGAVVDFLNIEAMAEKILQYHDNKELLQTHSSNAYHKLKDLHQDKNLILEQFESIINKQ